MPTKNLNSRFPVIKGPSGHPTYNLTDLRFGRLTVVGPIRINNECHWQCVCDCGGTIEPVTGSLIKGHTQSCGCIRSEMAHHRLKTLPRYGPTHGMSHKVPEYKVWAGMRSRCFNRNADDYHNYGGRGITIDPRWDDFAVFYADMGSRPTPQHQLDRKDNNGPYAHWNCRWATHKQQSRNRRSSRLLTVKDQTKSLAEWAELLGVATDTITRRLGYGWSVEEAVSTPPKAVFARRQT